MKTMMKLNLARHIGLWTLFGSGTVYQASATILPDNIQAALERQDVAYIEQPGYQLVDLDGTFWDRYYTILDEQAKKTGQVPKTNTISMPDSEMAPIERALRVLETAAGELPHVRYQIEYQPVYLPDLDYWEPRAHIQITRFNLGPTVRREVLAAYGPENTASPEEFGVGPHVRWRFVVAPVQNMKADIWMAAQQTLSPEQAQAADCFGTPCLSTEMIEGPSAEWQAFDASVPNKFLDLAGATGLVADTALGSSNLGYGEIVEGSNASAAQLILVATDGLGSDPIIDVMAYEPVVMDDAIQSMWLRRIQIEPNVDWMQLPIYRPGRN